MEAHEKVTRRFFFFALLFITIAMVIVVRIVYIQVYDGEKYRQMAKETTVKKFLLLPERGSLYSDDGGLLATSITRFDIRFDPMSVRPSIFKKHINALCDSLSKMFRKPSSHFLKRINAAKSEKNRYLLLARQLNYSEYMRLRQFPIFNLGTYKGGLIADQKAVRENPFNHMAHRTIGYDRIDDEGYAVRVGLEGGYSQYLRGQTGNQLKQKIAGGQWKPISDINEIDPVDGKDVVSTINLPIQDITHKVLLKQLKKFKAGHGCAVVMEVKTGEIKAMSNLGKDSEAGSYYEKLNYAVGESQEPGSTFKLMSLVAALDQRLIDVDTKVNTQDGSAVFFNKYVRDTKQGGYGLITIGEAFTVSSNVGFAKMITQAYKDNPGKFIDKLNKMGIDDRLGLPIPGEGYPYIPNPSDKKKWYGTTLPWMAFGYGVSLTPMQTLAFYNAVANDGVFVKPKLAKAVKEWNKITKDFTKNSVTKRICSIETARKAQKLMQNVVSSPSGTGYSLHTSRVSIAGKTGTSQKNYSQGHGEMQYVSSFVGYFPAENPKYSCIVVISEPDKSINYYGAYVAAPVVREIAEKIYIENAVPYTVKDLKSVDNALSARFNKYYSADVIHRNIIPDLRNMPLMDAIALLENMGLRVKVTGSGKIVEQSIPSGSRAKKRQTIVLKLSS